MLYHFINYCI